MIVRATNLEGILILEPTVYPDSRGSFYESFNIRTFETCIGRRVEFVQDNHSISHKGVLRGLHYQFPSPQGKLIRAIKGSLYDVVVDIRKNSPTFGQWFGIELSEQNKLQLWIPEGFAHGFQALTDNTECNYKVTDFRCVECERIIRWDDPTIGIQWPISSPILAEKDSTAPYFSESVFL
jgi:dTDP-4-dehydrorhamnose 3,5-epimerase